MLASVFEKVLHLSVSGAIVTVFILLAKFLAGRRLPARFHYAIWLLLLLKLVLPVEIESRLSLFNALPAVQKIFVHQGGAAGPGQANPAPAQPAPALPGQPGESLPSFPAGSGETGRGGETGRHLYIEVPGLRDRPGEKADWLRIAGCAWLAGMLAVLAAMGASYARTARAIRRGAVPGGANNRGHIAASMREVGLTGQHVRVILVKNFETPFLFGFFRPAIILPDSLARDSAGACLINIFKHEHVHLKRCDPLLRLIMLLLQAVHWFNPLLWAAFALAVRDCERSCDAAVVSGLDQGGRAGYASTLLRLAEKQGGRKGLSPLPAFGETNIKRRIKEIMKHRPYSAVSLTIGFVIIAVMGVCLLTSAAGLGKHPGFEIYLVQGLTLEQAQATALADLPLERSPLITGDDLVAYDWEDHTFLLKDNSKLGPDLLRRPFVVVAGGDRIYMGAFWSPFFSMLPPEIQLYRVGFSGQDEEERVFKIVCWQPGGTRDRSKMISDRRIYRALRELNLLGPAPHAVSPREPGVENGSPSDEDAFRVVDADYDRFAFTGGTPYAAGTDMNDLEAVLSDYILARHRDAFFPGEKAVEAHKIFRIEENWEATVVYLQFSFGWFASENGVFTAVSGRSAVPARLRLARSGAGAYTVVEYREAPDGSSQAEFIREMFPQDLAETVIHGGDTTGRELWAALERKAREYLASIGRAHAPVHSSVPKDRGDAGAEAAIESIIRGRWLAAMRRLDPAGAEFPDWIGTREALVRAGGPAPGINVRCVMETACTPEPGGSYLVILTRTWLITVSGEQPVSTWKYRVSGNSAELIEVDDQDGAIKIIK